MINPIRNCRRERSNTVLDKKGKVLLVKALGWWCFQSLIRSQFKPNKLVVVDLHLIPELCQGET